MLPHLHLLPAARFFLTVSMFSAHAGLIIGARFIWYFFAGRRRSLPSLILAASC